MPDTQSLTRIAGLLSDPTRSIMINLLLDGRAYTATELAIQSGVTYSTASSHLSKMINGGLLRVSQQGRHRYFRIESNEVASAIEGLIGIASGLGGESQPTRVPGPKDERLRRARVCYDHLAGEAGVLLLTRLREREFVTQGDVTLDLTRDGEEWCRQTGIDLVPLHAGRRRICRLCLDWSERRSHLAGALGAAILDRLLTLRFAHREVDSRVVVLTPAGERFTDTLQFEG
ncbi:MAG TPA: helix-turn-helix transcriptional regulator [Spirochaetia bacterium]|nr:helix-turn-helix transcriptional regulator [Spirochaetia bacterium]